MKLSHSMSTSLSIPICFGAATLILALACRQAEARALDSSPLASASAATPKATIPTRPSARRADPRVGRDSGKILQNLT